MGSFHLIDIIVILGFFVLITALGLIAWRKNKTSEDYFVAGKQLGTFSLAAMWLSSWIGGASIVGTANDGYNLGISGGWYVSILALGTIIFGLTFSKLAKNLGDKLQNITYPALISSRYNKRVGDIVIISCFLAGIGFVAAQLVAMAVMLNTVTGWGYAVCFITSSVVMVGYTAFGGLLAVTYTTWATFTLTMLGTVVLGIPFSAAAMGGFSKINTLPAEWFSIGRYGWSTILALGVSSIFSFYTSMDSYTRCFAAKNATVSRNGTLLSSIGVLAIAVGATYMGMAARVLMPDLPAGSSPYAAIVVSYFPQGVAGLVFAGVLAAIMDTGIVSINCCAANISVDIYKERINPNAPDRQVRTLGIVSSLVAGAVGALLAWWKYSIVELLLMAFTFQAASLFFPTVLGMFWKRATIRAAFSSMLVSLSVVLIWTVGNSLSWGGVFQIDALWPGLLVSGVVFMAVSLFRAPTDEDRERIKVFFGSPSEPDGAVPDTAV